MLLCGLAGGDSKPTVFMSASDGTDMLRRAGGGIEVFEGEGGECLTRADFGIVEKSGNGGLGFGGTP